MDGNLRLSNKERAELRQRFLKKAAAAFERMFGKANQDQLVTFTQREDLACLLGEEMTASLLEEHAAKDQQVRPTPERACCPQCSKPGKRVTKRNEKLEERPLTTRAGPITLRREKWRCAKCRIIFFSAGPQTGVGDGGLQSTRHGESGAAARDQEVQAFREKRLLCAYAAGPQAAAVMLDGGRVQTRAEESGQGVQQPAWRETKVACCLSLSSPEHKADPQPEPPAKFLDPPRVARLARGWRPR